jgi:hypothetical protein
MNIKFLEIKNLPKIILNKKKKLKKVSEKTKKKETIQESEKEPKIFKKITLTKKFKQ